MPTKYFVFLLFLFCGILSYGQVKIGDNVSTIDEASILELESTTKVLVLTRITNTQMLSLNPLPGGMVYNTDTNCVYSYNGANWVNLCNSSSGTFSFVDNNDGTFTINNSDGSTYTSSNLTGPQGPAGVDGVNSGAELEQIVIVAYNKQTQFNTPFPFDDSRKIEVYRNGVRIDFTTINTNTIELESDVTCFQNDSIRIVQIL
ncbi:hypothetical protein [Zobellia barbeyronii]|uniref:Uncharacterized protein n=1 Tax=Zobellia barbeyronii TaxID=2748009 RepID=A0ABS5WK24_9FLAO|nr:hypothetical protein [Zobellia barbeyronii]MBT2163363.1 hypothetical protein [Zobellia barbeyronii]